MLIGRSAAVVAAAVLIAGTAVGTGYAAAKITGKDVKNNSLTGVDVKNGSLRSADVANGSLKKADLAAGLIPSGEQVVVMRQNTLTSSSTNASVSVSCHAGEQAVGGSAGITSGSINGLNYFDPGGEPVLTSDVPTGWSSSWFNGNNNNNTFVVRVLCLSSAD